MKKRYILLIAANGISLLLFAVFSMIAAGISGSLDDQQVISRWTDGSERYSQVSVFTAPLSGMSIDSVFMTRVNIDKKLVENSIVSEKENARLWADAFSFEKGKVSLISDYGSTEANAIVTGGDFFLFHELELLSGYYYSDDDLMHDRILIDETLAWQLYGSSDIEGKHVILDGKYFYISGVYKRSEDPDAEKLMGTAPLLYIPYQGNELIGGTNYFTCYEVCMPNPVSGLAEMIVRDSVSVTEENRVTVVNSERYSLKNRFSLMKNFRYRTVRDSLIVYPWWENMARISEDSSATLLVWQIASLAVPTATLVGGIILAYIKRKTIFAKLVSAERLSRIGNFFKRIFSKIKDKIQSKRKKGMIADE